MKALFICLTLGLLAGCATTVWEHPTRGMAYFERDRSECEQQAANEEMAATHMAAPRCPSRSECETVCMHVSTWSGNANGVGPSSRPVPLAYFQSRDRTK
jgi:ferredoxin